jgi:hypothetical protein
MITHSYSKRVNDESLGNWRARYKYRKNVTYVPVLNAHILLGFESEVSELEKIRVEANIGELEKLIDLNGQSGSLHNVVFFDFSYSNISY